MIDLVREAVRISRNSLAPAVAAAAILGSLSMSAARGDRNVLAPRGLVTNPDTVSVEYASQHGSSRDWLGWINIGMPQQLIGLELEVERFALCGKRVDTASLQYSFTGNALTLEAPAVSVGVRDILNRGRERRALFMALTKTIGLSSGQERLLRDFKVHAGVGSSRLEGPFLGFQAKLAAGPTISAEYVARRTNASLGVRVNRYLDVKASLFNGDMFWGASVRLAK